MPSDNLILAARLEVEANCHVDQSRLKFADAARLVIREATAIMDRCEWKEARVKLTHAALLLHKAGRLADYAHAIVVGTMSSNGAKDIEWSARQLRAALEEPPK